MNLCFVSSTPYLALDDDLPLIVDAARAAGVDAQVSVWDDPGVDWSAFGMVVVRSCWDYIGRREEFLGWAESVPGLRNDAGVLRWNTDKTYLRELDAAGIPVIETRWNVRAGDDLGSHREWVVKPTISAGSRDTARWTDPADVVAHSEALQATGRTSMTQPYVESVDAEGETAMLFIGGAFSHAIRKGPLLLAGEGVRQDRDSREQITPRTPTGAQRELAEATLAAVPTILGRPVDLLYARVDLVTAADGSPVLIELELTEPSLFLSHSDGGAERLVRSALR